LLAHISLRIPWDGYNQVTITRTISGTNAGTVTRTEEYQSGKGLWDWLQLLGVLAVPVVVGFGAVWFTTRQGKVADAENTDNQRETALQAYIDKMSELLLDKDNPLRNSGEDDEIRKIARVRTLTVLRGLDPRRMGYVIMFLSDSKLTSIIDLSGAYLMEAKISFTHLESANLIMANLESAQLTHTHLEGANLKKANLKNAKLSGADLTSANLDEADLSGAKVTKEQLDRAKSLQGATMPDGSIQP